MTKSPLLLKGVVSSRPVVNRGSSCLRAGVRPEGKWRRAPPRSHHYRWEGYIKGRRTGSALGARSRGGISHGFGGRAYAWWIYKAGLLGCWDRVVLAFVGVRPGVGVLAQGCSHSLVFVPASTSWPWEGSGLRWFCSGGVKALGAVSSRMMVGTAASTAGCGGVRLSAGELVVGGRVGSRVRGRGNQWCRRDGGRWWVVVSRGWRPTSHSTRGAVGRVGWCPRDGDVWPRGSYACRSRNAVRELFFEVLDAFL
jgi:hypothetical protein